MPPGSGKSMRMVLGRGMCAVFKHERKWNGKEAYADTKGSGVERQVKIIITCDKNHGTSSSTSSLKS